MKKIVIIIFCLVLIILITVFGNNYYYINKLGKETNDLYGTTTIINPDRDIVKSKICIFISGAGEVDSISSSSHVVVIFSIDKNKNIKIVQKEKWNNEKTQNFITEIYNLDKHNVNADNYIKVKVKGYEYYINQNALNKVVYDYFKINL